MNISLQLLTLTAWPRRGFHLILYFYDNVQSRRTRSGWPWQCTRGKRRREWIMSDNEHLLRVDELRASMNIHDANDEEIYAVRGNRTIPNEATISNNNIIKFYRNISCAPFPYPFMKFSCIQNNDSLTDDLKMRNLKMWI